MLTFLFYTWVTNDSDYELWNSLWIFNTSLSFYILTQVYRFLISYIINCCIYLYLLHVILHVILHIACYIAFKILLHTLIPPHPRPPFYKGSINYFWFWFWNDRIIWNSCKEFIIYYLFIEFNISNTYTTVCSSNRLHQKLFLTCRFF